MGRHSMPYTCKREANPAGLRVHTAAWTPGYAPAQGGGAAWRTGCFRDAPAWVQAVMADGFKTAPGAAAVAGLFGAPLWLWARRFLPGTPLASPALGVFLVAGRLLAGAVEAWVVVRHVRGLLREDARGDPGPDCIGNGVREE